MKLTKLNRILIASGVVGMIATAVASAIGTYKAYPKIKKGIDEGEKPIDIVKNAAKDYIPALGAIAVAGGCMVASEVIGEREINKFKNKLNVAAEKYNKVSTWYKDQSEAIDEKLSDKNKKLIDGAVKEKEKERFDKSEHSEICIFKDPFTNVEFEGTESDILIAINDAVNKHIVKEGYATYEDFYGYLGVETPDDFKNFGWSFSTASSMWCDPWVDISFIDEGERDGMKVKVIEYVSDYGRGYVMPFEPVEEPQSDGWN